jgi:serine/threonine-protein kinase
MSAPRPSQPGTDRNLLFGVLAVQLDFVSRDDLLAGMNAWVLDKQRPLGDILCERGALPSSRRALLDTLVEEHLRQHGGDAGRSLAALGSRTTFPEELTSVPDPDVRTTLSEAGRNGTTRRPAANGTSRYRLLRSHARGGLGEVFVAEDQELNRLVAVKEIQPERADDPGSRSRFVLEAEITGALEHPGVVPIYGLGAYPDGRPYYAMRFIRGDSLKAAIDRFHEDRRAGRSSGTDRAFRDLLRRFIDTCNAVAYAHSRGVIHRDLKPANVMLGKFGETLVLDWGLAKAGVGPPGAPRGDAPTVDPVLPASSATGPTATRAGAILGTPGYMSPEQAAGRTDEVGPASDVYSLGMTLHVLLTGRKPLEPAGEPTVAGTDADTTAANRRADTHAPAALVAVCRKAMAENPTDRYASSLDLAADVERWLADESVSVFRDPWPVRAGRWARRHRTAVAAGLVFLVSAIVAMCVGTGLVWREQQRTTEQKRLAEENYGLARELSASGIDLIESSEAELASDPAKHSARKEILMAAARTFRTHLERDPDDAELRRRTARVYRYAANVHRLEREYDAAEPLYRDAVGLLERLAGQFADEPAYRLELAEALRDQAKVQSTLGRLAEAAAAIRQAIDVVEGLLAAELGRPAYRRSLAASLGNLATVELQRGRYAETVAAADRSAALFGELAAGPDRLPYDRVLGAAAINARAVAERDAGRPEAARPIHARAVNVLIGKKDAPARDLNLADVRHVLNWCRLQQARTWADMPDRRADAEKNLTGIIADWEGLADQFKNVPMYRESLGVAYQTRGYVRLAVGRGADAKADLDRSQSILENEVKRSPSVPHLRGDLGRTYALLARADAGRAADWLARAKEALDAAVRAAPDSARDLQSRRELE